jgi:hypothetical protein
MNLGYTLPQSLVSRIKVDNARIYLQALNPFYWTKCELSEFNMRADIDLTDTNPGGPDTYAQALPTYHATRTIVLGINLKF